MNDFFMLMLTVIVIGVGAVGGTLLLIHIKIITVANTAAAPTPPPYNAFAYNCSQLESLVNQNLSTVQPWKGQYYFQGSGNGGISVDQGEAIADLQIMQLKGCKVN